MHISNIRLGLATNSSSTHSLIMLSPDQPTPPDDCKQFKFGWDHFTLASQKAKQEYLAVQVYQHLCQSLGNNTCARLVAEKLFGVRFPIADDGLSDIWVDHQSQYALPCEWNGSGIDLQFVADLRQYFAQHNLLVLGGNDNDEESHPLLGSGTNISLKLVGEPPLVARKDKQWWVLFNRQTGAKLRLSFQRDLAPYEKATWPELVDLKITDRCDRHCPYCYQSSSPKGAHADDNLLECLAYALGASKVFEVAIGGGEPTLHPHFWSLLRSLRYYGVVPNFSTGCTEWLNKANCREAVMEGPGRFAYSPIAAGQIEEFVRLAWGRYGIDREKFCLHFVLGVNHPDSFARYLKTAAAYDIDVVLLGYKRRGRGEARKPYDYSGWMNAVRAAGLSRVSIDTAIAQEFPAEIAQYNTHGLFVTVREGTHSMYLDAVTKRIGPSSYEGGEALEALPEQIEETWARFQAWS